MTTDDLISALGLPFGARMDQRVPKKLLLEKGASTSSDKRQINDGIEEIHWLAVLKPTTIGVPDYRDDVREYPEIAVLSLVLREEAKSARLMELVHRAVPYPVLLIVRQDRSLSLSLAHKRWSQGETDRVVIDGAVVGVLLESQSPVSAIEEQFMQALALDRQPRTTLYDLYQGWMDTFHALLAARLTGVFTVAVTPDQAAARRLALQEYRDLNGEAARLQGLAAKEKQLSRLVDLNLELKRVQAELASAKGRL
ncbi:MAG: DUF4391 domain-containing protein [Leptospirales bacterium]